jgi:hypothetical protein
MNAERKHCRLSEFLGSSSTLTDCFTSSNLSLIRSVISDKGAAMMVKKQSRKAKGHVPKTVLRLPDLDQAKSAILNSLSSLDAQRGYRHAIEEFIEWYCSKPRLSLSKIVVLRYRIYLESRHGRPSGCYPKSQMLYEWDEATLATAYSKVRGCTQNQIMQLVNQRRHP